MNEQTQGEPIENEVAKLTLLDALAASLPELEGAKKNADNGHFKSSYADLGSVIDALRPLANHGVWFRQETHENENGAMVETFYIGHGEQISAGKLFVPASKRDAHGFGSALTYARRYALQTAFGLSSEDDDGNAASKSAPQALSDADWAEIVSLIEATKTDTAKFCQAFGITSLKALPASAVEKAKTQLNRKLEQANG